MVGIRWQDTYSQVNLTDLLLNQPDILATIMSTCVFHLMCDLFLPEDKLVRKQSKQILIRH